MGLLEGTRVYRLARAVAVDHHRDGLCRSRPSARRENRWNHPSVKTCDAIAADRGRWACALFFAVLFVSTLSFSGIGRAAAPKRMEAASVKENKEGH